MDKSVLTVMGMILLVGVIAAILWMGLNVLENTDFFKEDEIAVETTSTPIKNEKVEEGDKESLTDTSINVVASLEDKISDNSIWCGTLNLIWNDLKNDIAKQDIVFVEDPDNITVKNLNKGTFTTKELSEESYYKVFDIATLELKEKIQKAIKEKFNETSDILDDFDWEQARPEDYFLYVMLKKKFEFENAFTELEKGKFKDTESVEFFGVNNETKSVVRRQVEVLYYNSKDDFSVKLTTKQNDEVIIARGTTADSFKEIYEEIKDNQSKYMGETAFEEKDTLKIPNINVDLKKEFTELENKSFFFAENKSDTTNGDSYRIDKVLQTIKLKLDKEGGEIKSEAGMMVMKNSVSISKNEPREFNVDDTFTMFLIEEGKDLPYFAMKISDITKVQK